MPGEYTDRWLDGSEYERIRLQHGFLTGVSVPAKVRRCGYLLVAASAALPLVAFLPGAVSEAYLGGAPTLARLTVTTLMLFGAFLLGIGGLGLLVLLVYRSRFETVPEAVAWNLVGLETVFTGMGLVTGTLTVAVTLVLLAVGYAGPTAVESLQAAGVDPYRTGAVVSVAASSTVTFCVGIVLAFLGVALADR
jgi:hypothetical protein